MLSECYVIACVSLASWYHVTLTVFFLRFGTIGGTMFHENRLSEMQHSAVHLKLALGTWIFFLGKVCEHVKKIARKHIQFGWISLNLMHIYVMQLISEEIKCWK